MSVAAIGGGRYRVERTLGDGAMATVLLAHDAELDRRVAIKVLDERLAADDSFRARFTREARLAAALSHPNLVTIFDAGTSDDGDPYIVMEYVDGRTLEDRLRDDGPLPPSEVRRIALDVCAGLEHAHRQGLIHRDLKPGNLIERLDGTVKIADFGIARGADATDLTEAGTIVGTAAYLAPEQAQAAPVTPAADLYALGVVLYELLTGRRPWKVESLADLGRRRLEPPPPLPDHVPGDLADAIEQCLAVDPTGRPRSAAALAQLLEEQPETATIVMRPHRPAAGGRRARRRRVPAAWLVAALVALVAGLGVGGVYAVASGGDATTENATVSTAARPAVETIPDGETPAEDARNLADWLRDNSR